MRKWKLRRNLQGEAKLLRFIVMRFFSMGFVLGSLTTIVLIYAHRIAKAFGY